MESLSELLQPYKDIVANIAIIITIGQFFTGSLICKDIYNAGSSKGHSSVPFIGGIVLGILMLFYGLILNDEAMLMVNYFAISLNVLYALCFYIYSDDKSEIFKSISYGTAIVSVVYAYIKIENPDYLEFRLGMLVTIALLSLIGSPLLEIGSIIENRNAEKLPMPIIISGTLVSFMWLLYGVIILNNFMIIQNVVGLFLCITQILVFIFFRGGAPEKVSESIKKID